MMKSECMIDMQCMLCRIIPNICLIALVANCTSQEFVLLIMRVIITEVARTVHSQDSHRMAQICTPQVDF